MKDRKMLQVRLNPHFFYNTLNGMMALNRMGEKKKLERSIMNLAELCRYGSAGSGDTALAAEECLIEKQYMDLENLKYSGRIAYEIEVEESCEQRPLPRLLLQPILENSIVHGMRDGGEPLTIKIRITEEDKGAAMKLLICDDGAGFDAENVLRDSECPGISYVKALAKEFDKEMTFSCTSRPGEGTETVIVFRKEET